MAHLCEILLQNLVNWYRNLYIESGIWQWDSKLIISVLILQTFEKFWRIVQTWQLFWFPFAVTGKRSLCIHCHGHCHYPSDHASNIGWKLGPAGCLMEFIPQLLTVEQKETWLSICTDLLQQAEVDENYEINYYRWWVMGLCVWCWNKARAFTSEVRIILKT